MPAKGRYFLNDGEEGLDRDALYEKYRLTSQHGPLLLTLLLVAIVACVALIVITFSFGVSEGGPRAAGAPLESGSWLRSPVSVRPRAGLRGSASLKCCAGGRQGFCILKSGWF